MADKLHAQNKASQKTPTQAVVNQLQSRSFAVPTRPEQKPQTQLATPSHTHNLANISISSPSASSSSAIQKKAQPGQKQEPLKVAPSGSGQRLPKAVQRKMESAFGTSFNDVRIHEGPEAKSIGAIAYTRGSNIHFQPGKYNPHSQSGQQLLGHELTHFIQQRVGRVATPQGGAMPINADSGLESEADTMGAKAARGESVQVPGIK